MKLSEFKVATEAEFGVPQARVLIRDLVLDELDGRTAEEALADGVEAGRVWLALCRANEVPEARWHGRGLPQRTAR